MWYIHGITWTNWRNTEFFRHLRTADWLRSIAQLCGTSRGNKMFVLPKWFECFVLQTLITKPFWNTNDYVFVSLWFTLIWLIHRSQCSQLFSIRLRVSLRQSSSFQRSCLPSTYAIWLPTSQLKPFMRKLGRSPSLAEGKIAHVISRKEIGGSVVDFTSRRCWRVPYRFHLNYCANEHFVVNF